jgi:hypothetical protein
MSVDRHACPCCGFLTLQGAPPGTFEICPVCYWEDDEVQFRDPTYQGGANNVSLQQARINFRALGAVESRFQDRVRSATPEEFPRDESGPPSSE